MSDTSFKPENIRAIVGLGNPGPRFDLTRHNAGFIVLDAIADRCHASWQSGKEMEYTQAQIERNGIFGNVWLLKPQTFMNDSGRVFGWLQKKGIQPDQIIVVHDELEKKFGSLMVRLGGSHRGHNGLRSIMGVIGKEFWRLRIGIDRPADRSQVSNYVLQRFSSAECDQLSQICDQALDLLGLN